MKKTNLKVVATAAALCALLVGGGTVLAMGNTGGNQLQQDAQGEISEQQAKEAVLAHAGIAESRIFNKIRRNRHQGQEQIHLRRCPCKADEHRPFQSRR